MSRLPVTKVFWKPEFKDPKVQDIDKVCELILKTYPSEAKEYGQIAPQNRSVGAYRQLGKTRSQMHQRQIYEDVCRNQNAGEIYDEVHEYVRANVKRWSYLTTGFFRSWIMLITVAQKRLEYLINHSNDANRAEYLKQYYKMVRLAQVVHLLLPEIMLLPESNDVKKMFPELTLEIPDIMQNEGGDLDNWIKSYLSQTDAVAGRAKQFPNVIPIPPEDEAPMGE